MDEIFLADTSGLNGLREREQKQTFQVPRDQAALDLYPAQGESIAGFMMRLGETLGWTSTTSAISTLGISIGELRWGPRQRRGNSARLSGHQIPLKYIDLDRRRVCLPCLAEERFLREWWEISVLSGCPHHGTALIDKCSCGTPLSWTDTNLDGCDDCGPNKSRSGSPPSDSTPFETWVLSYLRVMQQRVRRPEIDDGGLSFALRLLENLATLSETGFSEFLPAQDNAEAVVNRKLVKGFDLLVGLGLEEVVSHCFVRFRSSKNASIPTVPTDALGWFGMARQRGNAIVAPVFD